MWRVNDFPGWCHGPPHLLCLQSTPKTCLREPELLPLRERWVRNLSAEGLSEVCHLQVFSRRPKEKKVKKAKKVSQSSCRGCCWRRGQWLDTPRKHTRGEARRLKGIGEWKREAGDLRERVRADEVKDDWRRGNVEVESAGWKEGKKAKGPQESKRTILPLAAPGLGITNSPTCLPHALASDKKNRILRVSLFQFHGNSKEN